MEWTNQRKQRNETITVVIEPARVWYSVGPSTFAKISSREANGG